jgi:hypothetical protein
MGDGCVAGMDASVRNMRGWDETILGDGASTVNQRKISSTTTDYKILSVSIQ